MSNFRMVCAPLPHRLLSLTKVCAQVVVLLCLYCQPGLASSTSLLPDEQKLARNLAEAQAWPAKRDFSAAKPHELGVQTLSIELGERNKGSKQRVARVYQFNYQTLQARLIQINLDARMVVKQQNINSVHLPLNQREIDLARTLVEGNSSIMAQLNQNRSARGLGKLNGLSLIDVKASIFEPDDNTHTCAKQRCALLSLFDQTRTVFAVEPLVNLQTLTMTTLANSL